MALEPVTWLSDLVVTNPTGPDFLRQGDDHIRNIKTALVNTLPGLSRAIHLERPRVDVASAASPNIGNPASDYINITGTTNITSFAGGVSGMRRLVRFAGTLTLTHSAGLSLPAGRDMITQSGDHAIFFYSGTAWGCVEYMRATGVAASGADASLIQFGTFSGSNSLPIPFPAGAATLYRGIRLRLTRMVFTSSGSLLNLHTSGNGGAAYDVGVGDYSYIISPATADAAEDDDFHFSSAANVMRIIPDEGVSSAAGATANICLDMMDVGNTSLHKMFTWIGVYTHAASGDTRLINGAGARLATALVDAVRLQVIAGTFSCNWALYGIN